MHRRSLRAWLVPLAMLLANVPISSASAATRGPATIAMLGTQWNNGYVNFTTPIIEECLHKNVYVNLTTDGGRAAMSVLLTAHASGRPISRIDYSQDADGLCWLVLVQI